MDKKFEKLSKKILNSNDFKITVVIPTYNTGKFLHESVRSLMNQTIGFDNIEVIFIDDKSTDSETIDLLVDYASEYNNCRVFFLDENSGFPGYPRNVGIDNASSDFVMVMDHDDSYEVDALERLYDEIIANNADVAISNFNQVFEEGSIPFKSIFGECEKIAISNISEEPKLLAIPAAIWTRLFRKSFLKKNNIRFLEGMLAEDVYFATNTSINAEGIVYLNNYYGYNYKIRDTDEDKSTIHIRNKKYIDAILNGFYKLDEMIKSQNKEEYADIIFKSHLTSWLYTVVLSNTTDLEKKQLFKKAATLYKNRYIEDPYFKGRYSKLVDFIVADNFDLAIDEVHEIAKYEKNMNESLVYSLKKNKILNKFKNIFKHN